MNIHLHIDHLVLDGLPVEAGHGPHVQAAVEAELTRLLASGTLTTGLRMGGARPSVPSNDIHLTGHDTPASLGQQIGQAVYGGISR
jgi:hypothetical protein